MSLSSSSSSPSVAMTNTTLTNDYIGLKLGGGKKRGGKSKNNKKKKDKSKKKDQKQKKKQDKKERRQKKKDEKKGVKSPYREEDEDRSTSGGSYSDSTDTSNTTSSSISSNEGSIDESIPTLIPDIKSKFYIGELEDDEETITPADEGESESQMSMFPDKHLAQLPKAEVIALKKALEVYADRLKFEVNSNGGPSGKITSEILTRLMLSRESLLQGASWLISHVEKIGDNELKLKMINDSAIWGAVLKIALRDPLLTCGIDNVNDPKLPSWDKIKSFLFYTEKGRRGLRVVSNKRNAGGDDRDESIVVPNGSVDFKINKENGYYYYLKQAILTHKDEFYNTSGRHYDLDVSNWSFSNENVHVGEMIQLVPIWSHLDSYADSFIGNYSNIGINPDDTVVLACKGRHFKRYDLLTGIDVNGCTDLVLPVSCEFLSSTRENSTLQRTILFDIGTDAVNKTYDTVWNTCIAPASCRQHLKDRIKSIPHCSLYKWYKDNENIKVVVKNTQNSTSKRKDRINPCTSLCDTMVMEKSIVDALYEECAMGSKIAIAHIHVMKNGDILCIFEDNPLSMPSRTGYDDRSFVVVWYRLHRSSQCKVTTLGRFKFSDLKKTRTFVNGKEGSLYPVNVKKYVTHEKVKPFVEFGTTGNIQKDSTYSTRGRDTKTYRGGEDVHSKMHLINRIISSTVNSCLLDDSATKNQQNDGMSLSFSMLVDTVKTKDFNGDSNHVTDMQDEIWSMTLFFTETPALEVKGVVSTRFNKEHVWGRTTNKHYPSNTRTTSKQPKTKNEESKTVSRRGFYDRKRARMDVQITSGVGYACGCYCLILSDYESLNQDNTLIVNWSEPYSSITNSNIVSLWSNGKKNQQQQQQQQSSLNVIPTNGLSNDPEIYDSPSKEIISHETTLTAHCIPGPFSKISPSLVLGHSFRYENDEMEVEDSVVTSKDPTLRPENGGNVASTTTKHDLYPCVVVHRNRRIEPSNGLRKPLDCISTFDCWMPTLGSTIFEKDIPNTRSNSTSLFDLNFHYDKTWIYDNLLVALTPVSSGTKTCVKVFKFIAPSFSGGSLSSNSTAKALNTSMTLSKDSNNVDFEIESTENFFLLNSTYIKNANAIDLNEFVGGRRGKLGDFFETNSHAVLLLKEKPDVSTKRLDKYRKDETKKYDPIARKKAAVEGETGECKPHEESKTIRTVKIYSKIWDGDWFTSHQHRSSSPNTPQSTQSSVNDTIFYDFDVNRVCTNPKCKKTGCSSYETKTPMMNWYFCNDKCQESFYNQMKR